MIIVRLSGVNPSISMDKIFGQNAQRDKIRGQLGVAPEYVREANGDVLIKYDETSGVFALYPKTLLIAQIDRMIKDKGNNLRIQKINFTSFKRDV